MTHICVSTLIIIGSDNGLSPGRRQAIILTNDGISLIGPLGANFSEILITIHTLSLKKMHLKMPSGKWRPFFSASMYWVPHPWPLPEVTPPLVPDFFSQLTLLLLEFLFVTGLADLHADLVARGYRPLKVHPETQVIIVGGKLPEQTGAILVSWYTHLNNDKYLWKWHTLNRLEGARLMVRVFQ